MRETMLALVLALTTQAVAAEVYRWIDDAGNTVYSQIPPRDGRPVNVPRPAARPAEPAQAQKQLRDLQQRLEDSREDRQLATESLKKQQEKQKIKDENCRKARKNLAILRQQGRPRIRQPDGSYRRYTASETAQKIAEQERVIERDCR